MIPMQRDGGLKRFQERMRAIPKEVREAVKPALMRSGNELAGSMKALAPVDEGDLRDSIEVTGPGERTPPYSQPGGSTTVPENAVAVTAGNSDVRYGERAVQWLRREASEEPRAKPPVSIGRVSRADHSQALWPAS